MKLKNPFSPETRKLFEWNYECFVCGESHADSLHHILGRVSDSPLNASPVGNLSCHIGNHKLESFEEKARLLQKTHAWLTMNNYYRLTKKDKEFMDKYKKYYEFC